MNGMAVDKCKAKVADEWWVSDGLQASEDENDSLKGHKGEEWEWDYDWEQGIIQSWRIPPTN